MRERLFHAAATDDIEALYAILDEDPPILRDMKEKPVANTPLHVAAAHGYTSFATELTMLQPALARKLNQKGLSPMHVALQTNHFETARALMNLDPELIRVKGKHGFTSLHYLASKLGGFSELLELLAEFLCVCGSAIDDLTWQGETAVHIAVKNRNLEAFKILFGWLKRAYLLDVLDMKDADGNTVLHIAASTSQLEVVQLLVRGTHFFGMIPKISFVKVNVKNLRGQTALDIFEEPKHCDMEVAQDRDENVGVVLRRAGVKNALAIKKVTTLSHFLKENLTLFERFSRYFGIRDESTRNMILMVATLIATATYQAALTPPGGYWPDDLSSSSSTGGNSTRVSAAQKLHQAGNMILSGWKLYRFMLLNGSAFLASIFTILATAIGLYPDTLIVYLSITILAATYFGCINSEFPSSKNHAGYALSLLYMYAILVVLFLPLVFYVRYWRHIRGVEARKRWVVCTRAGSMPQK